MDLFNRKKVEQLQNQLSDLQEKYAQDQMERSSLYELVTSKIATIEELQDCISMMDDELLQVAQSRYLNKYLEYTDQDGTIKVMKVNSVMVDRGEVFLTDCAGVEIRHTLSHLHTIAKVTTKKIYQEYQSTYQKDQEL